MQEGPEAQLTQTFKEYLMIPLEYKSMGGLGEAAKRPLPTHRQGCRETALPASQLLMRSKAFWPASIRAETQRINPLGS